jgi:hypothetical protein
MNPHEQPCQATPSGDLRQQILDSRVPKNEREWWAAREIEKLERELAAAKGECEELFSVNATGAERLRFVLEENSHLRAELAVAENWVEHHSKHADDLIGENVRLRAELASKTACYDIACGEVQRLRAEVEAITDTSVKLLDALTAERERVSVLMEHGVEALMVARSWQMVWGDKLSTDSVAVFTKHEQAFISALAATEAKP